MTRITYLEGDATQPQEAVRVAPFTVIAHVCNNIGGWGSGFVVAVSRRWSAPEDCYRAWGPPYRLGDVQLVQVEDRLYVANIIGQNGTINNRRGEGPPVRYEAIREALAQLAEWCLEVRANVAMPRIGCGLAGGSWAIVEQIVEEELTRKGVAVFVYDFPGGTFNP